MYYIDIKFYVDLMFYLDIKFYVNIAPVPTMIVFGLGIGLTLWHAPDR